LCRIFKSEIFAKFKIGKHLSSEFKANKGLRQEDAIASLLFNVVLGIAIRRYKFNVHVSARRNNIVIYIQQDATLHSLFYLETALHVSVGTITHHQKRKQLYLQHLVFVTLLLLSAAIVEELELVSVCCGWSTRTSSNSSTIMTDSSNGVTNTRCCRYSCLRSW